MKIVEQTIHDGWYFTKVGSDDFFPAQIPGTIHTDLLKNGIIQDPFYGCNEKELQWIGDSDWVYQTTFVPSDNLMQGRQIELVFEGLDTYATVWLNDKLLFEADNMFRTWKVDVKPLLKAGQNKLRLRFASALGRYRADSAAAEYFLPGGKWMYARKAAYHFGWDWGPVFITAGIWKPAYLRAWNETRVLDIFMKTKRLEKEKAFLQLETAIVSEKDQMAMIKLLDPLSGDVTFVKDFRLKQGDQVYQFDIEIVDPILWWSNGLGKPHLYHWKALVTTQDGESHQEDLNFGIRTIELVQEDDDIGTSFSFRLNGKNVFARGANYIPQHSFLTVPTDSSYRELISQAVAANMNMLRVWGGGVYERDIFYSLCDQHGIMVWQDFMFACAMYPGDSTFLRNVATEATEQLKRLRKHPSIALWCGNNEVDEGWHNWGWQKQYQMTEHVQQRIWEDYTALFHHLLPDLVETYHSDVQYVSSSPKFGWGRKESMTKGDSHYWGVWWGKEPFESYQLKVPRFMSEFGFQAMPSMATIRRFQQADQDFLFSPALKCHQKHPTGFETIDAYLERESLKPESLEAYIFASQLIQAHGITMAVKAHRNNKPRCMGSLYWQLNDVWPVTSWSGIDSRGNWKALHYSLRQAFADVLITAESRGDSMLFHLVSEKQEPLSGRVIAEWHTFDGKVNLLFDMEATVDDGSANHFLSLKTTQFIPEALFDQSLISIRFESEQQTLAHGFYFLAPFGKLKTTPETPSIEISKIKNGFEIGLKASNYVLFNQLYLTESDGHFSENFFHLFPGETKKILCITSLSEEDFRSQLRHYSLNEILNK